MSTVNETERTMLDRVHATWHADSQGTAGARYIVAEHVNNGAGFGYGRTLDAIVFDSWPSKGLLLHGLEVKVSASDFRRELQDTRKFAEFAPYLDHFSIVAPKGVVKLDLLPEKWGLYCPTEDGRLRASRKPLMLHTDGQRDGIDRSLAAAFCRALIARSSSKVALDRANAEGYERAKRQFELEIEGKRTAYENLDRAVEEFQDTSGILIRSYGGADIGEAVRRVLKGEDTLRPFRVHQLRDTAHELLAIVARFEATA